MYKKTQDQFGKSSFKNRGHLSQEAQRIGLHQMVKNLPPMQETQVQSLGQEDALEEGMATHSSILAWRSPWTEEPGGLQSMGSQRVGHNWASNTHTLYLFSGSVSCLVMSNSLWPHGLQPARLLCPWDSPGQNTGVGCHFLLHLFSGRSTSVLYTLVWILLF